MIKSVFLDRDGVINVNIPRGYVMDPGQLVILPGVSAAIKKLNDVGIPVVVISNQQGVGKGLMTSEMLSCIDDELHLRLKESDGATIIRSYYCTHLMSDGCDCRKPKGGQIRKASRELLIDLSHSIFVGDTSTDMQAGRDAGVSHCALVMSGATKSFVTGVWPTDPDSVHRDLEAAVNWILARNNELERAAE